MGHGRACDHSRRSPRAFVISWPVGEGAVLKQDQRGLGLLAIDGPAERRLTRREVVGLTRIVLQNFPQTIVHSISGGSADVGPGSGVEHDLNEVIASQLETIV